MNLLPEKFEVIDFQLYKLLCDTFKEKNLGIEDEIDYKFAFKNNLFEIIGEEATNDPEKIVNSLNLDLIKYFQFPYVQKNEVLTETELVRFELNFRAMNLLQVIDEFRKRTYLVDFIYQQLIKISSQEVTLELIEYLSLDDVLNRAIFRYGETYEQWKDSDQNFNGFLILRTLNLSIGMGHSPKKLDNVEIEKEKELFYIYDKLGIIDFLTKLDYHNSDKNITKLSDNHSAMGRLLNVLMGIGITEKDFNRKYFADYIYKKGYTKDIEKNGEEILKMLKLQKRNF